MSAENNCYLGPFLLQKCAAELKVHLLPYDYINPISLRWMNKLIAYHQSDRKFLSKTAIRKYLPNIELRYGLTKIRTPFTCVLKYRNKTDWIKTPGSITVLYLKN